ncbi:unnamed protein product [Somion occarium]|uniref:C2 domain-containing protein n=1 Tax=Somion occarium TaxID=3059160 RepID=A0ABP1D6U2_9APHY
MAATPREIGTLIVVILKARNLPNKRHIGKQDPYCSVSYNGEKRRTKAIRRGGQHPEWDEEVRFTLYEDSEPEAVVATPDGAPPPPPPKKEKALPKIRGGKFMGLACYAEDLREPDLIGETKVDLTEVLTKGETDEWFTLMHKDKYSGEVYLELTFWSNEPPPVRKVSQKPKSKKNYGGPGSFVPSGDSPPPSDIRNGSSRLPSTAGSDFSRDSIPSSLRVSSSAAKLDLYVPPYETSRSQQHIPSSSVDMMTNEFAELGVQNSHRRVSFPPSASGHLPRPSSSIGFAEPQIPSYQSYSYDRNSYSESASIYSYDGPPASTSSYLSSVHSGTYQAPYESSGSGYPPPPRQPRYSIPPSSSGFLPLPTPAPSGFMSVPSLPSQPSGFLPPAPTPASLGYGAQPPNILSAVTPVPTGYGPLPPSQPPLPTSSFSQLPLHHPTPSHYVPPLRPSTSYQALPSAQPNYSYQQYPPTDVSNQPPHSQQSVPTHPATSAPPAPPQPLQQSSIPPPPPPPQHSYSVPIEHGTGPFPTTPSPTHTYVPPPPPLNESPQNMGSRPLPQPGQNGTPQGSRKQPTLPIPPSSSAGSHSPSSASAFSAAAFNGQVPPPPPLPGTSVNQYTAVQHHPAPGPPPPLQPASNLPSSSFPQNHQVSPQGLPQALTPAQPQGQARPTRRPSLPAPPMGYPPQQQFQTLPPPPPPPVLPQQAQHEVISIPFPSANTSQALYPGPLPRPPSQYLPHGYPASVSDGNWQY